MDRDLRIPYIMSEDSIDLIRLMLDRDVESRVTIEQVVRHPWFQTVDTWNRRKEDERSNGDIWKESYVASRKV